MAVAFVDDRVGDDDRVDDDSVGAEEPVSAAELEAWAEASLGLLGRVDAASLSGAQGAALTARLAVVEKVLVVTRSALALRAVEGGEHIASGVASPAEWLSRLLGGTRGAAGDDLRAMKALAGLGEVEALVAKGSLSLAQGAEIALTEAEVAGSAPELVALAQGCSLRALWEEGRRRRLCARHPDELAEAQRRGRRTRTWTDAWGMTRGSFALGPVDGVGVAARLRATADRVFRAARRHGQEITAEQAMADALVALINGEAEAGKGTEVVVVADIRSLLEGEVGVEGLCHVLGGGPIPVAEARRLATGAFIKAVLHDGTDITTIAHYGRRRRIPALLATALGLGCPPLFTGMVCSVCGAELGLQLDHLDPLAHGGPTSLGNLDPKCGADHVAKTLRDWACGLIPRVGRTRAAGGSGTGGGGGDDSQGRDDSEGRGPP